MCGEEAVCVGITTDARGTKGGLASGNKGLVRREARVDLRPSSWYAAGVERERSEEEGGLSDTVGDVEPSNWGC